MEDSENDLFAIDISSSDSDSELSQVATPQVPRDFQSEENFQKQKESWRARFEVGELHKTLTLPLNNPSKPTSQTILHAIEELYFFKRYAEALKVAEEALRGELMVDFRKVVVRYWEKCEGKIKASGQVGVVV